MSSCRGFWRGCGEIEVVDSITRVHYSRMIAQAEIRKLPFQEKLALLEAVWSELSAEDDRIEVPQWHKDILNERREALERGEIRVLDWDVAKKEIEASIR